MVDTMLIYIIHFIRTSVQNDIRCVHDRKFCVFRASFGSHRCQNAIEGSQF